MCATKKQIASNRKNAQKATGPKTPEGKKIVSQNAVKHGLFARDMVIKSPHLNESQEEFDRLVDSLKCEFRPVGVFQEYLVNIMADCIWRRRRAVNAETARIEERLGDLNSRVRYTSVFDYFPGKNRDNFDPENDTEISAFIKKILSRLDMIPTSDYGDRIVGYQTHLDVQLLRAYRMLMRLKKPGALGYTLAPDKKGTKKGDDTY
ncbi:MAG: hypothetical protein DRP46_07030 [Candidatus Zixiibacteriota bacterium]|nr:MAG: hypothetical protein DRP46_07030 [candidate division Zixibacteria bacterium]